MMQIEIINQMPSNKKIWISATELRNYLLNDPLLDWLEINAQNRKKKPKKSIYGLHKFSQIFKKKRPEKSTISDYLMNQGHVFEEEVVDQIERKVGKKNLLRMSDMSYDARDKKGYKETVKAIKAGIPVIHGGILHNKSNNTFGVTDLLVRADYFGTIFKLNPLKDDPDKLHRAPKLPKGTTHYRVIDIKYSSLPLRADGIHLLNSGRIPSYKGQLWVYNEALALVQGYNPNKSYLMGRKWSYENTNGSFCGDSTFDRAGVVNFTGVDFSFTIKSKDAVEWMKEVKEPSSNDWNVTTIPLSRPELYPNMSNKHDDHWHSSKVDLAERICELTSIWMVGTKHRLNAHQRGIFKWSDPKCTAATLGIGGEKVGGTVDKILKVNRGKSLMLPRKIKNNTDNWKTMRKLEFFVDFETVGSVFTTDPKTKGTLDYTTIFIIGVGHIDSKGEWIYKHFTCNKLTPSEEMRICTEFTEYITDLAKKRKCPSPRCYHWSSTEPNIWNLLFERYDGRSLSKLRKMIQQKYYWEWCDILDIFRNEPIVIKGAFNFSLKSIAKAMYSHGMIETTWDNNSSCSNGRDAMLIAVETYKTSSPMKTKEMKEIISYNEVDVKTLQEILSYIRTRK